MPRINSRVLVGLASENVQEVCSSGREGMHLSVYEIQAGSQSPELCEVLWDCKWRDVPLLPGTCLQW